VLGGGGFGVCDDAGVCGEGEFLVGAEEKREVRV